MAEDKTDRQTFPRFWLFVILVLGSVVLGDLNQRMADARGLEKDLESLQAQADVLDEEILYLEEQIELVNTDGYVDDWAHEEAKMVKGGEVLVLFIPTGFEEEFDESNLVLNTPSGNQLDVWLELIFGR